MVQLHQSIFPPYNYNKIPIPIDITLTDYIQFNSLLKALCKDSAPNCHNVTILSEVAK
jgi:hypothetical protein